MIYQQSKKKGQIQDIGVLESICRHTVTLLVMDISAKQKKKTDSRHWCFRKQM
jgi:hypothetical protein